MSQASPSRRPLRQWVPDDIDVDTPSVARVYDYALGGFHNFHPDRELAEAAQEIWPGFFHVAHEQRAFLGRAIQWLLRRGVRQFLDIGTGQPHRGGLPDLLQHVRVDTRAVHVDLDPVVVAHNAHLLDGRPGVRVIHGDLRDPQAILRHRAVAEVLDLAVPVAVVVTGVVQYIADADDPAGILRQFGDATVAGSYLALSHATATAGGVDLRRIRDLFDRTPTPMYCRSPAQIAGLLDGWHVVRPGLVPVTDWHPHPADRNVPAQPAVLAAVARKPRPRTGRAGGRRVRVAVRRRCG